MHKARERGNISKFVRVLKIFAVFVFHYSKMESKENALYLSTPLANHWKNRNSVLNGAAVLQGILLELHSELFVFVDFL